MLQNNYLYKSPVLTCALLAILLFAFFSIGLGDRPYSAPSESRYIEIGREMAESGDYITPRLDYVKYFEKPPLFYWMQAINTKLFGFDAFTARMPTVFFSVLLCLLTFALGNMLYGRLAGLIGCFAFATSVYLFALSRIVLVDVPVSVFMAATLAAFLYLIKNPEKPGKTVVYGMYIMAACAVLTKGLIGAVIPGAVVFLWLCFTGKWQLLKQARLVSGTLLFLLIAVPWHILVSLKNPEFPHFYFIHEHFERYLTKEHGRYQPPWFFLMVMLAGSLPWLAFAAQSAKTALTGSWKERKQDGSKLFLAIWIGFILFFFSLSDSKLIPYILPIFPPIMAFIGHYFAKNWQNNETKGFGIGLIIMLLFLTSLALTPLLLGKIVDPQSKVMLAVSQASDDLHRTSTFALLSAATLFIVWVQGKKKHLIITMLVVAALLAHLGDQVGSHFNKDSMQNLAKAIKSFHQPNDEVVLLGEYYQDLAIYLERRITLVQWEKTELSFGGTHENTSAWLIDDKEFFRRWLANNHLMFVVMREEEYRKILGTKKPEDLHLYLFTQDGRNMVFVNQDPHNLKPVENHERK